MQVVGRLKARKQEREKKDDIRSGGTVFRTVP